MDIISACAGCYVLGAIHANNWLLAYGQGISWIISTIAFLLLYVTGETVFVPSCHKTCGQTLFLTSQISSSGYTKMKDTFMLKVLHDVILQLRNSKKSLFIPQLLLEYRAHSEHKAGT